MLWHIVELSMQAVHSRHVCCDQTKTLPLSYGHDNGTTDSAEDHNTPQPSHRGAHLPCTLPYTRGVCNTQVCRSSQPTSQKTSMAKYPFGSPPLTGPGPGAYVALVQLHNHRCCPGKPSLSERVLAACRGYEHRCSTIAACW
jgi:hypothetical protein